MPIPRSVTLQRSGNIKVRVEGKTHCGDESAVVDGAVSVRYVVNLTVDSNGLDGRGFLVDQEKLHLFMVNTGMAAVPWREPCELLAFIWGYRLLDWVSTENTGCTIREFSLTLSPAPNAGQFTAHFTPTIESSALAMPVRLVA